MTKEEMKNRISMALKDPILQQGFEIICKENAELKEQLSNVRECFISASSGDDFEMAESAREVMEVLDISCYRHKDEREKSKLTKAKEIISELLSWERRADYDYAEYDLIKDKAEQFLNSEVEK